MSGFDPTFLTDPYRPPKTDAADPPPVDGEVRLFTAVAIRREMLGRFTLACADTLSLSCGLFTIWTLTHAPVSDWRVGDIRTLPEPVGVSATWGADEWRVTGVEP